MFIDVFLNLNKPLLMLKTLFKMIKISFFLAKSFFVQSNFYFCALDRKIFTILHSPKRIISTAINSIN